MAEKSRRKMKKPSDCFPAFAEGVKSDINTAFPADKETCGLNGSSPVYEDHLTEKEARIVKEITLDATVKNIGRVIGFIDEELEALKCPFKVQTQIDMAVDEMFSNIAHYAYAPLTGSATVRFAADEDTGFVSITFIDKGIPYNPLLNKDPDTTLSAEERKIGGLGIFLVKKIMDHMIYEYKDGQNILTIKKYIGGNV